MPKKPRYAIVGSGPAGISAAMALVGRGHHVTILDVGDALEGGRDEVVSRMSQQGVEEWSAADLAEVSGLRKPTKEAFRLKQSYGSSFSFAAGSSEPRVNWKGKRGFHHSHARGGLSNVWGASMLPFREEDIAEWPTGARNLSDHYRAVMDFVPCTASDGSLEDILPSYSENKSSLKLSAQAEDLAADLQDSETELSRSGIRFGKSRLAIRTGCQYCALCLSGCPYRLIYSSAQTLRDLIDSGKVTYLKRHRVEAFRQDGGAVTVSGKNPESGESFSLSFTRLFLAGGVIPTATLVLGSLGAFGKRLTLQDSQYFIYPLLKLGRTENVESERMHTSSQLFLEIEEPLISDHLIHIQIYGYSAFLREQLETTFLRSPLRNAKFRSGFLGRLMVAQGFLHSKDSGRTSMELKRGSDGAPYLDCRSHSNWHTRMKALGVGLKLLLQAFRTKAIPLIPALKIPCAGSSYHSGGSFPMKESPGEFETDTLGRLHGYPSVHIVDASVFPSIPATTVTFSLMANSHRIASLAEALDSE